MFEIIRTLYGYNSWANGKILAACEQLSEADFQSGSGYASGQTASIRETLVHMMAAQELWLARWTGLSPTTLLDPADFLTLDAIETYWAQLERHTQDFVAGVQPDVLERVFEYTNTKGQPRSYPLWQMMMQQAVHASQHRSEIALLLSARGVSPGDLDLLIYLDQSK